MAHDTTTRRPARTRRPYYRPRDEHDRTDTRLPVTGRDWSVAIGHLHRDVSTLLARLHAIRAARMVAAPVSDAGPRRGPLPGDVRRPVAERDAAMGAVLEAARSRVTVPRGPCSSVPVAVPPSRDTGRTYTSHDTPAPSRHGRRDPRPMLTVPRRAVPRATTDGRGGYESHVAGTHDAVTVERDGALHDAWRPVPQTALTVASDGTVITVPASDARATGRHADTAAHLATLAAAQRAARQRDAAIAERRAVTERRTAQRAAREDARLPFHERRANRPRVRRTDKR